jgi:hypothetical protein
MSPWSGFAPSLQRPAAARRCDGRTRYATLGFSDAANFDKGALWPVAFALKKLTAADEAKIRGELRTHRSASS